MKIVSQNSGNGDVDWQGGVTSQAGLKVRHWTGLCMSSDLFIFFMFTRPVLPIQGRLVLSDDIFSAFPASVLVCSYYIRVRRCKICCCCLRLQTLCPSSELKKINNFSLNSICSSETLLLNYKVTLTFLNKYHQAFQSLYCFGYL